MNQEGYTIRGVQKMLSEERKRAVPDAPPAARSTGTAADLDGVSRARDALIRALAEDAGQA